MILNFEDIINVADYNQDNLINILDLIFIYRSNPWITAK